MNSTSHSRRRFLQQGLTGGLALSALPVTPLSGNSNPTPGYNGPQLPFSIYFDSRLGPEFEDKVRAISPEITLHTDVSASEKDRVIQESEVYFGRIAAPEFALAKKLKWVQSPSAGVEKQLYPAFKNSNVMLTNAKGCYGPAIAEHTFGLLFSLSRAIANQVQNMEKGKWHRNEDQIELRGLTMGIVGFGGIGRQVARRAKAMDMRVLAADIQGFYEVQLGDPCDDLYYVYDGGLEKLVAQSDVVVCAVPHTPVSEGMFDERIFKAMKPGAYFINVSRGKLVKTPHLMESLTSGHLGGAGLDVTDPEPLPPDHPLWNAPRLVITSHNSGRSQYSWQRMQEIFVENVRRFAQGGPLMNMVDKEAGF